MGCRTVPSAQWDQFSSFFSRKAQNTLCSRTYSDPSKSLKNYGHQMGPPGGILLYTKYGTFKFFLYIKCFSMVHWQGWEFAHSLIAHSLIRSFRSNQMSNCERFTQIAQDKWATVSKSLRSLRGNEWPWANHSGRSEEMSNPERIAQVAQDKWATLSNSLRLLRENERMSDSLKKIWLKNLKSCY